MLRPWPFPWREPTSIYDDNGPAEPTTFTLGGASFHVAPTQLFGVDSLRMRFRGECLTCNEELHAASTGISSYIIAHLVEKHGWVNLTGPRA